MNYQEEDFARISKYLKLNSAHRSNIITQCDFALRTWGDRAVIEVQGFLNALDELENAEQLGAVSSESAAVQVGDIKLSKVVENREDRKKLLIERLSNYLALPNPYKKKNRGYTPVFRHI